MSSKWAEMDVSQPIESVGSSTPITTVDRKPAVQGVTTRIASRRGDSTSVEPFPASRSPVSPAANQGQHKKHSGLRLLLESLVVLAVAVNVMRLFAVEGFMITTGSMASTLWGYHYRISCPDCGYVFALGGKLPNQQSAEGLTRGLTTGAEAVDPSSGGAASTEQTEFATCPNCHYQAIQTAAFQLHEGDQLLVNKQAYEWKTPGRWNSVVFRNPERPTQAFAKRVVGLPGETIEIRAGDIYANGVIQRKTIAQIRAVRITVSDSRFQPQFQDDNYRDPWQIVPKAANEWKRVDGKFLFEPAPDTTKSIPSGLAYIPWVRTGGNQLVELPLENWPADLPLPTQQAPVQYNEITKKMTCRGALPAEVQHRLRELTTDQKFLETIDELFLQSHQQPPVDFLPYNPDTLSATLFPVRDLCLEIGLQPRSTQSSFNIEIDDGTYQFVCQFDLSELEFRLYLPEQSEPVRVGMLPPFQFEEGLQIEVANFDRQILVAVNGHTICEPYAYRATEQADTLPRVPFTITASGPLQLNSLIVSRDIYYRNITPEPTQELRPTPYVLGPSEYFVLGDNSANSIDSRHWPAGAVTQELLIGRPFVCHLPSLKHPLRIGSWKTELRIPDHDRIRWLY